MTTVCLPIRVMRMQTGKISLLYEWITCLNRMVHMPKALICLPKAPDYNLIGTLQEALSTNSLTEEMDEPTLGTGIETVMRFEFLRLIMHKRFGQGAKNSCCCGQTNS
jgi:hypothetical protein